MSGEWCPDFLLPPQIKSATESREHKYISSEDKTWKVSLFTWTTADAVISLMYYSEYSRYSWGKGCP